MIFLDKGKSTKIQNNEKSQGLRRENTNGDKLKYNFQKKYQVADNGKFFRSKIFSKDRFGVLEFLMIFALSLYVFSLLCRIYCSINRMIKFSSI